MRNKAQIDSINPDNRTGTLTVKNGPLKNTQIPFDIPFISELGMSEGEIIRIVIVDIAGTNTALSAKLPGRGDIVSINPDNQTGEVTDKSTGQNITFDQPGLSVLGIAEGSTVSYTRVNNGSGDVAVSLLLVE